MVGKGEFPTGKRLYHIVQPTVNTDESTEENKNKKLMYHNNKLCEILASIAAHRSTILGASCRQDLRIQDVCPPLLQRALEDSEADGEQPRAVAGLHGLCDWVKGCLEGKTKSKTLEKLREDGDDTVLQAVTAIATGIPRPGHSIVGQGTHRDGALGWEALAKEYGRSGISEECQLYLDFNAELVAIELLADTRPEYMETAGGAVACFIFIEQEKED
jgi:hypothetical protein